MMNTCAAQSGGGGGCKADSGRAAARMESVAQITAIR